MAARKRKPARKKTRRKGVGGKGPHGGNCKVVTIKGKRRRICRDSRGKITSNRKVSRGHRRR